MIDVTIPHRTRTEHVPAKRVVRESVGERETVQPRRERLSIFQPGMRTPQRGLGVVQHFWSSY
jgi:hypothetical protein